MLSNNFTNWDDQFYVTENLLLRGPDWKGIFSQDVVSNYHPITILTLALNYQWSALSPFSYYLVNWLIHILNVGLVFLLAYKLAKNSLWVAILTALFFGIHPMHVESVAWISERKDVLFTFFFLGSLLVYEQFSIKRNWKKYGVSFFLFALSLLSKPAAVTLPVALILLDWYQGRSLKDKKIWLEKIPFFVLALIFGMITLNIQAEKAIALPEYYPVWQSAVFAMYGFGEYIIRFVWPFPLSAIHPFPAKGEVPLSFYFPLSITLITIFSAIYFRKNKYLLFGILFYAINVAPVLQLLTFGNSIISERYTYVPYIGMAFALFMLFEKSKLSTQQKQIGIAAALIAGLLFSLVTCRQVKVWNNSETLWSKAIEVYPYSYVGRSNRGHFLYTQRQQYDAALADYNIALEIMPEHINSLDNRAIILLHQQQYQLALLDAEQFIRHNPEMARGYFLRAFTLDRMGRPTEAIADYTKCITLDPDVDEPYANRGIIYYNALKDFQSAKLDFDMAIQLNPTKGEPFLNRARCWVKFGNKGMALRDLESARQLGTTIPDDLMQAAMALP